LDDLIAVFDAAVTARERIRVLVRVRQFDGVTLEALRSVKMRGLRQVERYAPVGGPDWMTTIAQRVSPMARVETRHFAEAEEEQAWAWLEARPVP
jgi:hypothetical protein